MGCDVSRVFSDDTLAVRGCLDGDVYGSVVVPVYRSVVYRFTRG